MTSPAAPSASPTARSVALASAGMLLILTWSHFIVDVVATLVMPLWPDLQLRLHGPHGSILWLYVLWTLVTSITQLVFGYFGDRRFGRQAIWIGPIVALLCMSSIGMTTSPWVMAILVTLGGLGIAAFHPEAAVMASDCNPGNRSRATAIFSMGGFLGQAIGPSYAGMLTDRLGMNGLVWTLPLGLAGLAILLVALRNRPAQRMGSLVFTLPVSPLANPLRGSMTPAMLVLAIGVLRVVAMSGVPLALAFLLKTRDYTPGDIGWVQSCFMFGIGAGGLVCGLWVRTQFERPILLWCPILAAPLLLWMPWASHAGLMCSGAIGGVLLGITLPVLISFGQRMMPNSRRVASALGMGVSWGIGGTISAGLLELMQSQMNLLFALFAVASALSGIGCLLLPAKCD